MTEEPAHKSAMCRLVALTATRDRTHAEQFELDRLRDWLRDYTRVQRACAGLYVDDFIWDLDPNSDPEELLSVCQNAPKC